MREHPHALFVFAAVLAGWLLAAPAIARPPESGEQAPAAENLTTGSVDQRARDKQKKRFEDCMAIWDPGTHMTKKQWRRTCNTTLDEVPSL
jgi:hypothetical protein